MNTKTTTTEHQDEFGFFNDEIPLKTATKGPSLMQDIPVVGDQDHSQLQPIDQIDATPELKPSGPEVRKPVDEVKADPEPKKKGGITAAHIKIVASALILVVTAVVLWPAPPSPATVATSPVTAPTVSPTASPTAEPGVPGLPAEPGIPGPTASPGIDIATTTMTAEDENRLQEEVAQDVARIPPAEQTCTNTGNLTSFDRFQCAQYGAVKFYTCTEQRGRTWNTDIAGCELL